MSTKAFQSVGVIGVLLCLGMPLHAQDGGNEPSIDPKADKLLRRMSEYLAKQSSFHVSTHSTIKIESDAVKQSIESMYDVVVVRPNRLVMRLKKGEMGVNVVCDGKKLYVHSPSMNKYTVYDAPADLNALATESEGMMMAGWESMFLASMIADDPYKLAMEGVTSGKYVGKEEVNGESCHYMKYEQQFFDWDIWIQDGDKPLPMRIRPDIAKQMNLMEGRDDAEKMTLRYVIDFKEWSTDVRLEEGLFAFDPPEGAEKVDSFFEGYEEGPPPLLGEEAPDVELVLLDDRKVKLADLRDKKIVMLEFWATWCGPCVEALPVISRIADEYADKGVVFYAVNQAESERQVERFLKSKEIETDVAMDPRGDIAGAFGVNGIPHTVLIDKKGIVQSVHVGFGAYMKKEIAEELDALLEGKDLAAEQMEAWEEQMPAPAETEGVELAWKVKGTFGDVATSPKVNEIYAATYDKSIDVIDLKGNIQRRIKVPAVTALLRLGNLIGDDDPEFLLCRPWGRSLTAVDREGGKLWEYPKGTGIDDVWCVDLNSDGMDEVVIGYNGRTGLHVLDNRGIPLWTYTKIANVWHVCSGDLDGDGGKEVVTTSAKGQVHLFDSEGKSLRDLKVDLYANMIRLTPTREDTPVRILVGGSGDDGETIAALGTQGRLLWSLPGDGHTDSMHVSRTAPWVAVGFRGGHVRVADYKEGRWIAHVVVDENAPRVAIYDARKNEQSLLLIAAKSGLLAYHVKPMAETSEESPVETHTDEADEPENQDDE